jgi:hypothetical protein
VQKIPGVDAKKRCGSSGGILTDITTCDIFYLTLNITGCDNAFYRIFQSALGIINFRKGENN